eukprot:CAMPEP_0113825992 /NCGR_PEP_ID=MMETSP0328-20130328/4031_1 /TAXON_ID=39455 /ORGANISM="Alexandrium minutum" /LENGTH=101 /DNA_ID=CAMNT_0000793955 /DNA_START=147 /DNA_END=450 /DNA_ORIENTATION=+ /assembly_acc=CAM_ASM_000350
MGQSVKVLLGDEEVEVVIDPEKGPKVGFGPNDFMKPFRPSTVGADPKLDGVGGMRGLKKDWKDMSSTEQEVWVVLTAKKGQAQRRLQQAREEQASEEKAFS